MNRRTFDILVPFAYVIALVVAIVIGDKGGVGGVATIGAVLVVAYYAGLRHNIKT
jgi:hypothetical protein